MKLCGRNLFFTRPFHIAETALTTGERTFLHSHDFYEMFFLTEGSIHHYLNNKDYIIEKNTLCFIAPEDKHQFCLVDHRPARFLNLAFPAQELEKANQIVKLYISKEDSELSFCKSVKLSPALSQVLYSKLMLLNGGEKSFLPIDDQILFMSILTDCLLWIQQNQDHLTPAPSWLKHACEEMYLEENYCEGLPRFVELSGKSQEHLTRMLKQCYGMTPSEFINEIRLEQAVTLLKTTENTVLEVMLQCGFNNVSHFNAIFKKKYGVTPSQYRNLNRIVINPYRYVKTSASDKK